MSKRAEQAKEGTKRKARLIRVGADSDSDENLGQQSPLFQGFRYEYIPVGPYEDRGCYNYQDMKGMSGQPLAYYIRNSNKSMKLTHFDPDFIHLTYGDEGSNSKVGAIRKLQPNDLLIFWAGFNQWDEGYDLSRTYAGIFGWLLIDHVFDWDNATDTEKKVEYDNWIMNAHYRQAADREELDGSSLVVVHGKGGGQLQQLIIMGEWNSPKRCFELNEIGHNLLISGKWTIPSRSIPHKIHADRAFSLLKDRLHWQPRFQLNCQRCQYPKYCDYEES